MNIDSIKDRLNCKVLHLNENNSNDEIRHVIASDLMSDVLTDTRDNVILITSLCSEQSLRTADIIDAKAVIIVKGKRVLDGMIELAKKLNISLFSTKDCKFEASVKLGKLMREHDAK